MTLISDATICETQGDQIPGLPQGGQQILVSPLENLPQSLHLPLDLLRRDIPRLGGALG